MTQNWHVQINTKAEDIPSACHKHCFGREMYVKCVYQVSTRYTLVIFLQQQPLRAFLVSQEHKDVLDLDYLQIISVFATESHPTLWLPLLLQVLDCWHSLIQRPASRLLLLSCVLVMNGGGGVAINLNY